MSPPLWVYMLPAVAVCAFYCIACPYTKVEESFNIQAIHDISVYGDQLYKYDHLEFPGVVPRTFIGALLVAPASLVARASGLNPHLAMLAARLMLGALVLASLYRLVWATASAIGRPVAVFLALLTAAQFHVLFYATRPLPNTFAWPLVMLVFSEWVRRQNSQLPSWPIAAIAAAACVFRAELVVLFGPILLQCLLTGQLTLTRMLAVGVPAGVVAIAVSVLIDSYFWQRLLWPEGEVLYYNTLLNKSSNWGTSPFHWYFTSALPRALSLATVFVPIGAVTNGKIRRIVLPILLFVMLYSILPHKELRFVMYAVPIFNIAAASGIAVSQAWLARALPTRVAQMGVIVAVILACAATSTMFFLAASRNYPGGDALAWWHETHTCPPAGSTVTMHIDVSAAQQGITRFGQLCDHVTYSKAEDMTVEQLQGFNYLVHDASEVDLFQATHKVIHCSQAFAGYSLSKAFPFLQIRLRESICILERIR